MKVNKKIVKEVEKAKTNKEFNAIMEKWHVAVETAIYYRIHYYNANEPDAQSRAGYLRRSAGVI